jgi:hypothetical protein
METDMKLQVRLEVADGYTWVTVFTNEDLMQGDWDEVVSAKLDDVLQMQDGLIDIAALAHEGDEKGILALYREIDFNAKGN